VGSPAPQGRRSDIRYVRACAVPTGVVLLRRPAPRCRRPVLAFGGMLVRPRSGTRTAGAARTRSRLCSIRRRPRPLDGEDAGASACPPVSRWATAGSLPQFPRTIWRASPGGSASHTSCRVTGDVLFISSVLASFIAVRCFAVRPPGTDKWRQPEERRRGPPG
jgi:hypothetical protein